MMGVRVLDVRVQKTARVEYWVTHSFRCVRLVIVCQDILRFLREHSSESLMMILRGDKRTVGKKMKKVSNSEITDNLIPWMKVLGVPVRRQKTTRHTSLGDVRG
jgi:hypothetical protein